MVAHPKQHGESGPASKRAVRASACVQARNCHLARQPPPAARQPARQHATLPPTVPFLNRRFAPVAGTDLLPPPTGSWKRSWLTIFLAVFWGGQAAHVLRAPCFVNTALCLVRTILAATGTGLSCNLLLHLPGTFSSNRLPDVVCHSRWASCTLLALLSLPTRLRPVRHALEYY